VEIEHAAMGKVTAPGRPFVMSESPWQLRRPAPLLGEHTREVLAEAGFAEREIAAFEGVTRAG
jgi:crotonobetainyl-CoA:carnitine CoA-transferase CaiB-like acyl-CoA transferase